MHIDWWTLALQTVNVLILLWILSRFFFRPVMNIVAKRQTEATKLLSDAAAVREEAAVARQDAEKACVEIDAEKDRLMAEARKAAAAEKASLLASSSQEIEKLRSEAEVAIAHDRATAGRAMAAYARELSVDIARRLLARFPPATAFAAFLNGICDEVQSLSPEIRASFATAPGEAVEVVTAAPLSTEEADRTRDALQRAFGFEVIFTFRADLALIAGIELHGRNTVVRNTWRTDLQRIGEELGRDGHRAESR